MKLAQPNPPQIISDKRRKYEIAAVFLMGIGKIIFMEMATFFYSDLYHWLDGLCR
jgi:hypothetical protein